MALPEDEVGWNHRVWHGGMQYRVEGLGFTSWSLDNIEDSVIIGLGLYNFKD